MFGTNSYNKRSSKKYGWRPDWFGGQYRDFNSDLAAAIKTFQKRHDLGADGKVGPITFKRLLLAQNEDEVVNYILIKDMAYGIDCDVKINLIKPAAYRTVSGIRQPNMIVTHWDVTTSADKCKRVLEARGISTHFCIDNDGTIHQYVDPNNIAWHAGRVNRYSIGIDFSNAYYEKYNKTYVKMGFEERPVLANSRVHGIKLKPHLGYYPVQIEAYKKLIKILCNRYKIPHEVPLDSDGKLLTAVDKDASRGRFKGVVCHYHLTRNKIDCAGLELDKIVKELFIM